MSSASDRALSFGTRCDDAGLLQSATRLRHAIGNVAPTGQL